MLEVVLELDFVVKTLVSLVSLEEDTAGRAVSVVESQKERDEACSHDFVTTSHINQRGLLYRLRHLLNENQRQTGPTSPFFSCSEWQELS